MLTLVKLPGADKVPAPADFVRIRRGSYICLGAGLFGLLSAWLRSDRNSAAIFALLTVTALFALYRIYFGAWSQWRQKGDDRSPRDVPPLA